MLGVTIDDIMRSVLEILPNATVGEDSDGQVVIYTNLRTISSDGHVVDMGED